MKEVVLKDLCEMKSGGTPSRKNLDFYSGNIPWAKISDLEKTDDGYISYTEELITDEALNSINNRLFKKGTLLLAMYGSVGKTAISKIELSTNQAILGINIKDEKILDIKYLKFWFTTIKEKLLNRAVGAALPNISLAIVKELQIPLPPIDQQKKIASILDAADAYRQKTKSLLAKYDELTQSLFLDMFGDPVKNEKGWEKVQATKYYEVRGRVGWKGYKKTDLRESGAIVIGATHVTNKGDLDLSKIVYLSEEKFIESPEIIVNKNDLIFVQRGNTIGKVCLVRNEIGKATINPVVLIFRPIKANSYFLLYLLLNKELNREFVNSNSGSAQPMITQKTMKEFMFIDVPLTLQNQFAERVQAIEKQKASAQASYEKAEELFNSLLQKAFNGELM
jgi:type I restriction enzyme S subunit